MKMINIDREKTFIRRTLDITIPKGFMNVGVSGQKNYKYLIGDTNDSQSWDTFKFPLPYGDWIIKSVKGKNVTLIESK